MRFTTFLASGAAFGLLSLLAAAPAAAEEGMWTFDNFPAAKMRNEHGWSPDQAWLDRARKAAVRLTGGCSASFVSPNGLILTNHHCVIGCLQNLATKDDDLVANGFNAADRTRERMCPGQQAEVVTAITDVTPRIRAAIGTATGEALVRARNAEIAKIESENCTDRAKTRCQVVTLFGGGQYKLYSYRKYSDVRIVWAPEFQAAFFGGDPDNFNFPRYALDASFLRAYEDGKPVAVADFLRWNPRAPIAGETTFVVGNPGSTQRMLTQRQMAFRREVSLPLNLILMSEYRGRLITAMAADPERARQAGDMLFGIENSFKAMLGQFKSLNDADFAKKLADAEADLRRRSATNASIGDPWSAIDAADAAYRNLYLDYRFLEAQAGGYSSLYNYAEMLVRGAKERTKPNADRLPGYTDSALPLLEKHLADKEQIEPWMEQLALEFWLSKTREYLTADSPDVKMLLGKESPEAMAARLVSGTQLADPAVRKQLWQGGWDAIQKSNDPLIKLALKLDERGRDLTRQFESAYDGPVTAAQSQLAAARFAAYGDTLYPDATFTLRISYGKVAGWKERGREVPAMTYMGGAFDRATGQQPFLLAKAFTANEARINKNVVYDFSTTNDIIGGNSGSPVIARDGSVIGAAFDGNIHSLGGNFGYDPVMNRTVVVSTAAVQQALEVIYPAPALVAELGGKKSRRR